MNSVVIIGRLTKDLEIRFIPGTGTMVASSTLAVDRDYTKKDGTRETDFIPFEGIGKVAEFMNKYLYKGRLVAMYGAIKVDNYETPNGERRTFTKIAVRNIQPLDKNKNAIDSTVNPSFEPSFEPVDLDPQGFQAIDDDDLPF